MIKELRLTNIVLVESAIIFFEDGFNVISGESGAGKSAILNALHLLAAKRSDPSYIRHGSEKGTVEATFDIDKIPEVQAILDEAGIDHEKGSELRFKREIGMNGKSRAFINHTQVQLTLLKKVADLLFDIIGQHANQKLLSLDYHRQSLDLFADLNGAIADFASCFAEENKTRKELDLIVKSEAMRMREIEICRMEIEELEDARLQEGEEEDVFAEYTELTNADQLIDKSHEINQLLRGDKQSILQQLYRSKSILDGLVEIAPTLQETAKTFASAVIELEDVLQTLQTFESRIESNPSRALNLNKRLELIAKIKKKYGQTIQEINAYLNASKEKLSKLESADVEIETLQHRLQALSQKSNALASKITEQRKQAAIELAKALCQKLHALNMEKVAIDIEVTAHSRTSHGDDKVEIYITPNVGEHRVSLKECASGGELSRMMLALQSTLAGKEKTPSLIFDEIDANIGGKTATIVGGALCDIAKEHQVLCITHFPQVAQFAKHHIRISKQEIDGRTVTKAECLDKDQHLEEISRMLGGMAAVI